MDILVVTEGAYSDFRVVALFDEEHRKEAELIAAQFADGRVGEMELNPELPKELYSEEYKFYRVAMKYDGTSIYSHKHYWEPDEDKDRVGFFLTNDTIWQNNIKYVTNGYHVMITRVWARDEKHAVKIANERRAMIIAANEWPEPHMPTERHRGGVPDYARSN